MVFYPSGTSGRRRSLLVEFILHIDVDEGGPVIMTGDVETTVLSSSLM